MSVREMVPSLSTLVDQRSTNVYIAEVCLGGALSCYSSLILKLIVSHSWRLSASVADLPHRHLVRVTWVDHVDFSEVILELINRLFSILFNHIVVIILLSYHRGLHMKVLMTTI